MTQVLSVNDSTLNKTKEILGSQTNEENSKNTILWKILHSFRKKYILYNNNNNEGLNLANILGICRCPEVNDVNNP